MFKLIVFLVCYYTQIASAQYGNIKPTEIILGGHEAGFDNILYNIKDFQATSINLRKIEAATYWRIDSSSTYYDNKRIRHEYRKILIDVNYNELLAETIIDIFDDGSTKYSYNYDSWQVFRDANTRIKYLSTGKDTTKIIETIYGDSLYVQQMQVKNEVIATWTKQYNVAGQLIAETFTTGDNKAKLPQQIKHYKYSDKGLIIEFSTGSCPLIYATLTYIYNDQQQLISIVRFADEKKEYYNYSYYPNGKLKTTAHEISNNEYERCSYSYNKKGLMTQKVMQTTLYKASATVADEVEVKTKYTYTKANNLNQQQTFFKLANSKKNYESYNMTYSYDAKNRPIAKREVKQYYKAYQIDKPVTKNISQSLFVYSKDK